MSVPPVDRHRHCASEIDASEDVAPSFAEEPVVLEPRSSQLVAPRSGFERRFSKRAVVMRSVPWVIHGAFRNAMRVALEEVARGF